MIKTKHIYLVIAMLVLFVQTANAQNTFWNKLVDLLSTQLNSTEILIRVCTVLLILFGLMFIGFFSTLMVARSKHRNEDAYAKDIKEKYIDPPNTTEYGIMFLPYESLFGEVLRVPGLFEQLQKDYKITITGPTTLSALLNSLQMGFRTLAIEKRSSEVWDLLGAVKTEFGQFGDVLAKTKKKLIEATNVIDT